MNIDTSTPFGARVERRLREERVIWLTTVRPTGGPEPSPVWFLWSGDTILIYSQPNTPKLRNLEANPLVALNFDGDGQGGNIIVIGGEARIAPDGPPAHEVPAYVEKYQTGFQRLGLTPESFAQHYSVPIVITPRKLRGH